MVEHKDKKDSEVIKINLKFLKKIPTHSWALSTYLFLSISIILIILLITGISPQVSKNSIKPKIESFINTQLIPGGGVSVDSLEQESGIYTATITFEGAQVPLYFTKDGKFINQGTPLESIDSISDTTIPQNNIVEASVDDDAVLGDPNAPVTIIEFSDFQCPYCEKFYTETYLQLKKDYIDTGKAKLIFRDFPLTQIHPQAQKAAEAAECARDKGGDSAFFKMHDKIFENQESLSETNLKKWAKDLGYNIDICLDSGQKTQEVLADLSDGSSYGISGTPSFFINGEMIEGAYPYDTFQQTIDAALLQAGQ